MTNAIFSNEQASDIADNLGMIRGWVARALELRPMNCLVGIWPADMAITMQPTDERVRQARLSPCVNAHLAQDRVSAFWGRDYTWFSLLREVMVHCLADDPAQRPVRLADLAARTGLSVASVHQAISTATETGDFRKFRAAGDKRLMLLLPSAELHAYFQQNARDTLALFAVICGRPALDPDLMARAGGGAYARLMIRSMSMLQDGLSEHAVALARRYAFYILWDLLLEPELGARGFIAEMARRQKTSATTITKVVEQMRASGLLEPGADLRPSAMAWERYAMTFSVFAARNNLLLDALEAVLANPDLAPALDPLAM